MMPMDFALRMYARLAARLMGLVGNFLKLREKILDMIDQAEFLIDKAQRTHDPELLSVAQNLKSQAEERYKAQLDLEERVQEAIKKIRFIEAGKKEEGLGVAPLVIGVVLAAISVITLTVGAVVIHTQRVNALSAVLEDVKRKKLTAAEAKALMEGANRPLFDLPWLKWAALGIVAVVAIPALSKLRQR